MLEFRARMGVPFEGGWSNWAEFASFIAATALYRPPVQPHSPLYVSAKNVYNLQLR
jgi:hypothetical protein